ncbi:MAG TPA: hypothetical protein VH092_17970 [Urbifossiella sp.]|nr:hypothetical protein [Urbifossiella sp.]
MRAIGLSRAFLCFVGAVLLRRAIFLSRFRNRFPGPTPDEVAVLRG